MRERGTRLPQCPPTSSRKSNGFSHAAICTHATKHVCHVSVARPYVSATPLHDEWLKPYMQSMTATQWLDVAKVSAKKFHGELALSPWRCDRHRPLTPPLIHLSVHPSVRPSVRPSRIVPNRYHNRYQSLPQSVTNRYHNQYQSLPIITNRVVASVTGDLGGLGDHHAGGYQ